ncbi:helix-turn-helix transcriptional regulator [Arthrobacter woluwensis]|uniref:Helix-turn-helix domain-containing protein n=1 Tax=Arthrobacter woluwensis TaxID=156980 RepID=A0A1H4KD77_9MICC|nr:helix-turn-helix transcriptional regulator [Arthrobacter woluwensis]SEB56499.1 Helix-turn-helix domain-containing protein [Arthrobacter woluwensis]
MSTNLPERRHDSAAVRRRWLGSFLRAKRESLKPSDVGLPTTERRRTPGLRREEVAVLASVGVTWYTWLEQGRDITVSTPILGAIAEALKLEGQELEHLYTLAGKALPELNSANGRVTETLSRLLGAVREVPAYIADRYWNVLAVNELGHYIFGLTPDSNCLVKFFTDEEYAAKYPFRETAATMMVAQFRQRAASFPSDTAFQLLADELKQESPEFAHLWDGHSMAQDPHLEVSYDHSALGRLFFDSVLLTPIDAGDLMLFMYIARPESAAAIERLS